MKCFFPRNEVTLNDSLCLFIYQGISFSQSGKVSSDLCYYHASTKWKLIQKETGYCEKPFSINKLLWYFYFHRTENVTPVNFVSTKSESI